MGPDFTLYPAVGSIILVLSGSLGIAGLVLSIRRRRRGGIIWAAVALALTAAALFIMRPPEGNGSLTISGVGIFLIACLAPAIVAFVLGLSRSRVTEGTDAGALPNQNGLALASVIVVWFSSVVGLILGHVALSQIRRTGESGRGMALTAVIVGWTATGLAVLAAVIVAVAYAGAIGSRTT
ncbi:MULTISPECIES: DUF4190 domain-containing protein [unclassified Leifsonia]|uniref:DUF4190 domain-containing protein n=1 Tax=unclassified Leifsonia TaxID=2663824 RepID=UPI0008A7F4EE|nr:MULTISPECIES: DUF4190 domain-containing protein [unclassified Leifsonia]SEI09956.1 protein of unknown function [Leifsonia sp. CL154]SFL87058.1 protein of unknown function [Leifsonia sp. CL147]